MEDKQFLTIRQAAEFMEVHIETLRRWDRQGKLPAIRIGKSNHRRYKKEVLEKFNGTRDADGIERIYMVAFVAVIMLIGIYPAILTDVIKTAISSIL